MSSPLLLAMSTFGKFPEDVMLSLHTRILVHLSQNGQSNGTSGHSRSSANGSMGGRRDLLDGMEQDSEDALAAEPRRKGGLVRSGGDVCIFSFIGFTLS